VTARGEVDEVAQRVSILQGKIMPVRRAWDATVEKILSLAAKAATADRRWELVVE
jgi:hypothetical protein